MSVFMDIEVGSLQPKIQRLSQHREHNNANCFNTSFPGPTTGLKGQDNIRTLFHP